MNAYLTVKDRNDPSNHFQNVKYCIKLNPILVQQLAEQQIFRVEYTLTSDCLNALVLRTIEVLMRPSPYISNDDFVNKNNWQFQFENRIWVLRGKADNRIKKYIDIDLMLRIRNYTWLFSSSYTMLRSQFWRCYVSETISGRA